VISESIGANPSQRVLLNPATFVTLAMGYPVLIYLTTINQCAPCRKTVRKARDIEEKNDDDTHDRDSRSMAGGAA
jgi:hypothetical protein